MKKLILLLLALQAINLNYLNAAAAAPKKEVSQLEDLDESTIDSILGLVTTVKTVAKKADVIGRSAIDKIKIVDKDKYKKVSEDIEKLSKQLKKADKYEKVALVREINNLNALYLSALNPKMLIAFLKENGYLQAEDDACATVLFTILNQAQNKADLFAILDFEQEPSADMIRYQELEKSVDKAAAELTAKQAELQISQNLLLKYTTINSKLVALKCNNLKLTLLPQTITQLTKANQTLEAQIAKLEEQVKTQTALQDAVMGKIVATYTAKGYSTENAKEIAQQNCNELIMQEDIDEENLLEMFARKTFNSQNLLRKILNCMNFKIFLKGLGKETAAKFNNTKLFAMFPWLILITETDLLKTLSLVHIIALHDLIFSSNILETENIIDSYYKPTRSKARKQLFDSLSQEIFSESIEPALKIIGNLTSNIDADSDNFEEIVKANAIKIVRMASHMPQLINLTAIDDSYKAKFISLLSKK